MQELERKIKILENRFQDIMLCIEEIEQSLKNRNFKGLSRVVETTRFLLKNFEESVRALEETIKEKE